MKRFLLLTVLSWPLLGQGPIRPGEIMEMNRYSFEHCYTLSSAPVNIALYLPSNSSNRVYWEKAVVRLPASGTVTFGWGGAIPTTGTPLTPSRRNTTTPSTTLTRHTSNAGTPARVRTFRQSANVDQAYTLDGIVFESGNSNTTRTLLITSTSVSGEACVYVDFGERT